MAKALMLQGTGSDAGKTLLAAGLCRAFSNRGLRAAPFKPQNMSNNAAVTADGGEIGRGQALQAFAARIAPGVHMNPVLLKPQAQGRAQIIAQGRVFGAAGGADYLRMKPQLLDKALESYHILAESYDYILAEGAGSPAEINLRAGDIANMGFAEAADMPVMLAGDIDRGGVIAALAGTHLVLPAADRARIIGYVINKFRGQRELFADGIKAIRHFTGWECFGIVPWLEAARLLPAEDSLSLSYSAPAGGEKEADSAAGRKLRIAVPIAPHIANFDDFDPLRHEPEVELIFAPMGAPLPEADIIMLGGSKAALADMAAFHACGRAAEIQRHAAAGGAVIGLCGGYQMLGRVLRDSAAQESELREIAGLGLLDTETDLETGKITGQRIAYSRLYGAETQGYEIHCGRSFGADCGNPPFTLAGRPEGAARADGKIWGTYLHGIFHNGEFRRNFLRAFAVESAGQAHEEKLDEALNRIAETLEAELNIDRLINLMR